MKILPNGKNVLQSLSNPWLITKDKFTELLRLAAEPSETINKINAFMQSKPQQNKMDGLQIVDNIAVIGAVGVLTRYDSCASEMMGGTSYDTLSAALELAINEPSIQGIILDVNSPGGEVDGLSELADNVNAASKIKPIVSYVSGTGASAAYWLAASTGKIVANKTALLGSIGTVATYTDYSKQNEMEGVKEIEFVSSVSPNKRPDLNTPEGKAEIQKNIDALGKIFVDTISQYRKTSADVVENEFGKGGVLIANDALSVGMIDKVGNFEDAVTMLEKQIAKTNSPEKKLNTIITQGLEENMELSAEEKQKLITEAAANERKRITAIDALRIHGEEDLISAAILDESMTAEKVSLQILERKNLKQKAALSDRELDAKEIPAVKNATSEDHSNEFDSMVEQMAAIANKNPRRI